MTRTIQDDDLRTWEVFATTGPYGATEPARIVFRCLTNRTLRARQVDLPGDKSDAEKAVVERSGEELRELFRESEEID